MKNRIREHRQVRACDLLPHPANPRLHPDGQRTALRALLEEIGKARSVLAYVSDADRAAGLDRLTLIDGHLRREELGDEVIDVEVLDVDDREAQMLLLAIDPLAQLATYDTTVLEQLRDIAARDSAAVAALWDKIDAANAATQAALAAAAKKPFARPSKDEVEEVPAQYLLLIECQDEKHQVALLRRFQKEGLSCQAKIS